MTHTMTSESGLSTLEVHQGQKGQVALLSPQPPRATGSWCSPPASAGTRLITWQINAQNTQNTPLAGNWARGFCWAGRLDWLPHSQNWCSWEPGKGRSQGGGGKERGHGDSETSPFRKLLAQASYNPKLPCRSHVNKNTNRDDSNDWVFIAFRNVSNYLK